jgi:hypothetical protein
MTRPAHFVDGHTADRQAWLQELQTESNDSGLRAMEMLVGAIGILVAVAVTIVLADWMTGLEAGAEIVSWRAHT